MSTSTTMQTPFKPPFVGFRPRRRVRPVARPADAATPARNPEALARLLARFPDLGRRFWAMSEDDYGDWIDALPFDEFLEYIGLGGEGVAHALRPYMQGGSDSDDTTARDTPETGEGGQESQPPADTKGRAPGRRRPQRSMTAVAARTL